MHDRPCPWKTIDSGLPHLHRLLMGIGGSESAAPEGRYSDSPGPCVDHGKRFAITHWHLMDIGGSESAAPEGRCMIVPCPEVGMESG